MYPEPHYHTPIEAKSGGVVVIDESLGEIHEGKAFTITVRKTSATAANTVRMVLRTGATKCHTVFRVSSNVACDVDVRESATLSASGSLLTALNRDRNSANQPAATVRSTATMSASGTLLKGRNLVAGGADDGTVNGLRDEFILKTSTVYVFRVVHKAGNAITYMSLDWHEKS